MTPDLDRAFAPGTLPELRAEVLALARRAGRGHGATEGATETTRSVSRRVIALDRGDAHTPTQLIGEPT